MNCPSCRQPALAGARFCIHCGTSLAAPEPAATQPALTQPSGPAPDSHNALVRALSPGDVLLDEYVVERVLGAGGMGKVYLVRSRTSAEAFAVKTALVADARLRQLLFRELRNWIALPPHPYLTACRFFKTIQDQVVIFAEYVAGGSLADTIAADAIVTNAVPDWPRRLDVLIQFAWGLHAAHVSGMIHRDVKPSNLLLQGDAGQGRVAKVCDFGVSSGLGRQPSSQPGTSDAGGPVSGRPVSGGGMTMAYRSPEQAAGRRLSPKTDQWSWSVSVLEWICGGIHWLAGEAGSEAFEEHLRAGQGHEAGLPPGLVGILRRCFRVDPSERWPDMLTMADELCALYAKVAGQSYPRQTPVFSAPDESSAAGLDFLRENHSARHWLGLALAADGRNPRAADASTAKRSSDSALAAQPVQLVEELRGFDEARQILERLVASGRRDQGPSLAQLCANAAFVHRVAGDHAGALSQLDRALSLYESMTADPSTAWTARFGFIGTCLEKARTLTFVGKLPEAAALFDSAIHSLLVRWQRSVDADIRIAADGYLAQLFLFKGIACFELGDYVSAAGLFRRALGQLQTLADKSLPLDVIDLYGLAAKNLATVLARQGMTAEALEWADRSVRIRQEMADGSDTPRAERNLADALADQAGVLLESGDAGGAGELMRQVVDVYERDVRMAGQQVDTPLLAKAYANLALATSRAGDHRSALPLFEQAIALLEPCVRQGGRLDLEPELVQFMLNSEIPLRELGRWADAEARLHRVVERLERLVREQRRDGLRNQLAMAYSDLAYLAVQRDDLTEACKQYRACIAIWRALVHQEGKRAFAKYLELAEMNLANVE